jgi:hypothetical protein
MCITLCVTGAEQGAQKFGMRGIGEVSSMYKIAAGRLATKRMQRGIPEARKGRSDPGTIGFVNGTVQAGTGAQLGGSFLSASFTSIPVR